MTMPRSFVPPKSTMNSKTKVRLIKVDFFGNIEAGAPSDVFDDWPKERKDVKSVLYDFYFEIEISDKVRTMRLMMYPLLDTKTRNVVGWHWEVGDETPGSIDIALDKDIVRRFFNRVSKKDDWSLKKDIDTKVRVIIDRELMKLGATKAYDSETLFDGIASSRIG